MEKIEIKAKDFFEILKTHDVSMWDIFAQMINGTSKQIIFLDETDGYLFQYTLPKDHEQLKIDRALFVKEYEDKLAQVN